MCVCVLQSLITLDGGKMVHIQKWDGKETSLVREVTDNTLLLVSTIPGSDRSEGGGFPPPPPGARPPGGGKGGGGGGAPPPPPPPDPSAALQQILELTEALH